MLPACRQFPASDENPPDTNATADVEQSRLASPPQYEEEEDRRRRRRKSAVQIVFFLLGIGVLLPWNAYINAKPYFQTRLCDLKDISDHIEAWFSILYNGGSVVSLAVVLLVQFFSDPLKKVDDGNGSDEEFGEENKEYRIEEELENSLLCSSSSSIPTKTGPYTSLSQNTIYYGLVMIPLGIYFVVFVLTTVSVAIINLPTNGLLWFTLGGFFLCGVCTSVSTSGVVGTGGLLDPQIGINPYFHGQAAGGLLVAIGNLVARAWDSPGEYWSDNCSNDPNRAGTFFFEETTIDPVANRMPTSSRSKTSFPFFKFLKNGTDINNTDDSVVCLGYTHISWSTAAYFLASCLILLFCMVGYAYVENNKQSLRRQESNLSHATELREAQQDHGTDQGSHNDDTPIESSPLLVDRYSNRAYRQAIEPPESTNYHRYSSETSADSASSCDEDDENHPLMSENGSTTTTRTIYSDRSLEVSGGDYRDHRTFLRVWRSVQGPAVALFWNYFVTLAIFPVWTSELSSVHQCEPGSSRLRKDLFSPLSFVVFNAGDLIGRLLSSNDAPSTSAKHQSQRLVLASIARFAFFPLFLVCAAANTSFESWVIPSDTVSWSIQFGFALSNGYLTNLAFALSPSLVENSSHPQQVASAILNFSLCLGLLCGSLFSFPFLALATGQQ